MNEEQKSELLDRLVADPPRRAEILDTAEVTESESAELLALAELADAAWLSTRGVSPADSDPIAAMLGVAPIPGLVMKPAAFKRARMRANVNVSSLRDSLQRRGWDISTAEVNSWQSREGVELFPALLQDIGDALHVSTDDFTAMSDERASTVHNRVRQAEWFAPLVGQWQSLLHIGRAVAEAQLLSRATATAHRGEEPDLEQVHEMLEHLVASRTERGGESR